MQFLLLGWFEELTESKSQDAIELWFPVSFQERGDAVVFAQIRDLSQETGDSSATQSLD